MPAKDPAVARWVARLDYARRTRRAEVEPDVERWRDATVEERDQGMQDAVRGGWRILHDRADRDAVLAWQDAPAADLHARWAELVRRHRGR